MTSQPTAPKVRLFSHPSLVPAPPPPLLGHQKTDPPPLRPPSDNK